MNKSQIIVLYDQDQRKDVEYPDTRREVTPDVVRQIDISNNREGAIIYSQLNEANANDMIREQILYFEKIGQDFEWKVYDYDKPSDLKERLASRGFIIGEEEAIMVLDLEDAPGFLWQPVLANVQRIRDPEKLSVVLTIEQEVWNEDFSSLGHYLGEALRNHPEQMSVYVSYIEGQPAI